jgi:hypothetical protein
MASGHKKQWEFAFYRFTVLSMSIIDLSFGLLFFDIWDGHNIPSLMKLVMLIAYFVINSNNLLFLLCYCICFFFYLFSTVTWYCLPLINLLLFYYYLTSLVSYKGAIWYFSKLSGWRDAHHTRPVDQAKHSFAYEKINNLIVV